MWFYRNGYRLISCRNGGKIYSLAGVLSLSVWFYRNGYRLISGCSGGKIYSLAVFCLFGSIETVIGLSLVAMEVRFIL